MGEFFVRFLFIWIIFIPLGIFFIRAGTTNKKKVRKMLENAPIYQAKITDIQLEKVTYIYGSSQRPRKKWVYMATLEFETEEHGVIQHKLKLGEDETFANDKLGTYEELFFDPKLFPQPKHISELEVNKSGTSASLFFGIMILVISTVLPIILYITE